jgi:anti-sigma factor ChrR (cupin superfamily)
MIVKQHVSNYIAMEINMKQTFKDFEDQAFINLDIFPGASWSVLSEPVEQGSIHRLKLQEGTVIPPHTHPVDEFVYVLSGTVKTGDRVCEKGAFWKTPANLRQGPHEAMSDVEIITIRLGPMGEFEQTT